MTHAARSRGRIRAHCARLLADRHVSQSGCKYDLMGWQTGQDGPVRVIDRYREWPDMAGYGRIWPDVATLRGALSGFASLINLPVRTAKHVGRLVGPADSAIFLGDAQTQA